MYVAMVAELQSRKLDFASTLFVVSALFSIKLLCVNKLGVTGITSIWRWPKICFSATEWFYKNLYFFPLEM